ncbi:hypothetical protein D3C87_1548510 [compost metagenome]
MILTGGNVLIQSKSHLVSGIPKAGLNINQPAANLIGLFTDSLSTSKNTLSLLLNGFTLYITPIKSKNKAIDKNLIDTQ